jgi:hypothetical protein
MPDNYLFVINNVEAWKHDDRVRGEKWKKISTSEYTENIDKLLPIYLLTGIRFDLWNKLEQQTERFINDKLCWHLSFTEKEMSSQNRIIPKQSIIFILIKQIIHLSQQKLSSLKMERKYLKNVKFSLIIENLNFEQW